MGIEAIKGAGMNFQASASAPEIKAEVAHKVEVAEAPQVSERIAKDTMAMNTKEASGEGSGGNAQPGSAEAQAAQIKRAVEEINKKAKKCRFFFCHFLIWCRFFFYYFLLIRKNKNRLISMFLAILVAETEVSIPGTCVRSAMIK